MLLKRNIQNNTNLLDIKINVKRKNVLFNVNLFRNYIII